MPTMPIMFAFTFLLILPCILAQPTCNGTARYRLKVTSLWATPRFSSIPSFAHFSPLIAATHTGRFSPFIIYGYATDGFKAVAETGDTSSFRRELIQARDAGFVKDVQNTRGFGISGGESFSVVLEADCEKRYVSGVTMLAPSPDWVVAVSRIDLLKDGLFRKRARGRLMVYDAGTDSGTSFTSSNAPTQPRENIAPLVGGGVGGMVIARYSLNMLE